MKQIQFDRIHTNPLKLFIKESFIPSELCERIANYTKDPNSGFNRVKNKTPAYWDIQCDTCRIPFDNQLNQELLNLLNPLWNEAIDLYKFEISHIEHYEIKRYGQNDYVSEHYDQFLGTVKNIERKLTLLAQLNEDYQGGELLVVKKVMPKSIGSVIILPSFYLHEVKPIILGNRFSLNCWAWGEYWK